MAEFVVHVGGRSAQGLRSNNEDRYVADPEHHVFLVADGMGGQVYVAGLGDSRAYLVRGDRVEQLTMDHTVADALERNGTLTHEQAQNSPWRHVLYKFLGCAEMTEGAEVRPFAPQAGDWLILA